MTARRKRQAVTVITPAPGAWAKAVELVEREDGDRRRLVTLKNGDVLVANTKAAADRVRRRGL